MPALIGSSVLNERNSAEVVGGRLARAGDKQLAHVLTAVVGHLHRLVLEIRPTASQWREAVEFLTEVGHASDERRQEWVLLSDLLGVTALIEEINSQRPQGATPNTPRGPFYRADAPHLPLGANICLDGKGEPLEVRARVLDLDGNPVSGATVETWQANPQGFYENQQPDHQPEFNLRGVFRTDTQGVFHYRSVKPAGYKVPDDGPVGQMLGRLGYPLHRPAHLHFVVKAKGFETLTTHIFDKADPGLFDDAVFGVRPELVAEFRCLTEEPGRRGWSLAYDFVMARDRKAGVAS